MGDLVRLSDHRSASATAAAECFARAARLRGEGGQDPLEQASRTFAALAAEAAEDVANPLSQQESAVKRLSVLTAEARASAEALHRSADHLESLQFPKPPMSRSRPRPTPEAS